MPKDIAEPPIATRGSKGIKKPKPDPLNTAEPAIPEKQSVTKVKNCSQAMKDYWAHKKAANSNQEGAKDASSQPKKTYPSGGVANVSHSVGPPHTQVKYPIQVSSTMS